MGSKMAIGVLDMVESSFRRGVRVVYGDGLEKLQIVLSPSFRHVSDGCFFL